MVHGPPQCDSLGFSPWEKHRVQWSGPRTILDQPQRGSPMTGGFGPWSAEIGADERSRRWRSLAGLAPIFAGPDHPLARRGLAAERGESTELVWQALESLVPLPRWRLLCAYAALAKLRRAAAAHEAA